METPNENCPVMYMHMYMYMYVYVYICTCTYVPHVWAGTLFTLYIGFRIGMCMWRLPIWTFMHTWGSLQLTADSVLLVSTSSSASPTRHKNGDNYSLNCMISSICTCCWLTLGSILGGKGCPVMITALPFMSAKSSPSLTWTQQNITLKEKLSGYLSLAFPLHTAKKAAPLWSGLTTFS